MKTTKTKVGIWIDHRKAFIVSISEKGILTGMVVSKVERHLSRADYSHSKGPFESQAVPADDSQKRAFIGHINRYYDAIIACIGNTDSILIFGPGEAKGELAKRFEKADLRNRPVVVEAASRMTNGQVVDKVRKHVFK